MEMRNYTAHHINKHLTNASWWDRFTVPLRCAVDGPTCKRYAKNIIKKLLLFLLAVNVSACTQTEKGLVFGVPDYEKRDIKVSKTDLEILIKTKELISVSNKWAKNNIRTCDGDPPFSLYCALEAASKIIDKEYIHRRPALQEVRFTIDDNYRDRWEVHRLADFNNHPNTTYQDVIHVLESTINRVRQKLSNNNVFNSA